MRVPEDILFRQPLGLKKIRRLPGASIHDHRFLWQRFCCKWLLDRGIKPNHGIRYFNGIRREYGKFDPKKGLPEPSAKDAEDRLRKLVPWQRKINALR